MDNEAFRSLVNNTRKTTKEIAREAVESEFKKRKRSNNDQGYGSDSDSDDDAKQSRRDTKDHEADDDGGNKGTKQKKEKREKKLEYRDRAKERREGKSVDYALLDVDITSSNAHPHHYDGHVTAEEMKKKQAELSKYLGGDEEHTHLVKGLDRVLAQKVRREEMGKKDEEEDFDELMDVAFEKRPETAATASATATTNKGSIRSIKPKSDLGRSILNYLLQKEDRHTLNLNDTKVKVNPALQKSIQRSILTFSLNSDTRRRKHAWDAPQLSIQAFTDNNVVAQKATPLDRQLITTISNKLNGHLLRVKHGNISKDVSLSADNEESNVNDQTKLSPDIDSDDDIFENAGTYVPPSANTTNLNGNVTEDNGGNEDSKPNKSSELTKRKQSIFDNLITSSNEVVRSQTQKVQIQASQTAYNKNVINRDVIGASTNNDEPFTKRRGPQTAAMEGFSMSNYSGGYGEEMDVDFGNFDEDHRKKKKDKQEDDNDEANKEEDNDF